MIDIFSSIDNTDEDHPVARLISSMTVCMQGPVYKGSACPYVVINNISVSDKSVTYHISACADIISSFVTPVNVELSHNRYDDILYNRDGLTIRIRTSGITVPPGEYRINARLRLRFISLVPERSVTVNKTTMTGGLSISSGYNVAVSLDSNTLSVYGGPGAGSGKYFEGGTDNLYRGIRNVNGVNLSNNLDVSMSDVLIENGGSVQ